jgi:hypothetical protein|tara:strand:- start:1228 stop:1440 length:213 start_codon:yes stop_codon:yes gene_type:complete
MKLKEIDYKNYTIVKLPMNEDRYTIYNGIENYIDFQGKTKWRKIRMGGIYSSLKKAKRRINIEEKIRNAN